MYVVKGWYSLHLETLNVYLTTLATKVIVCWSVTPWSRVETGRRFEKNLCLYIYYPEGWVLKCLRKVGIYVKEYRVSHCWRYYSFCSKGTDAVMAGGFGVRAWTFKLLKSAGHVRHQQFNIRQLYVLPTLYLCVLYLSENKQRLVPLTA